MSDIAEDRFRIEDYRHEIDIILYAEEDCSPDNYRDCVVEIAGVTFSFRNSKSAIAFFEAAKQIKSIDGILKDF